MEIQPLPHKKLTDEEIKRLVVEISADIQEIKEFALEQINLLEYKVHLLKRHYAPEKFKINQFTIEDANGMEKTK